MTYQEINRFLSPCYETSGEAKAVARYLLEKGFSLSLADIVGGAVERLSPEATLRLVNALERLQKGEPVQYVVGTAEFMGEDFLVNPGVLIPRQETEQLVTMAVDFAHKEHLTSGNFLDIGTGSGAIAISIQRRLRQAYVSGWDISDEALSTARRNARRMRQKVKFIKKDILLQDMDNVRRWHVLVSNPPYVMESERATIERRVLGFEPPEALFVKNDDPLLFYRHIARYGRRTMKRGGGIFFEINPKTAGQLADLMTKEGYQGVEIVEDCWHKRRFLQARWL